MASTQIQLGVKNLSHRHATSLHCYVDIRLHLFYNVTKAERTILINNTVLMKSFILIL